MLFQILGSDNGVIQRLKKKKGQLVKLMDLVYGIYRGKYRQNHDEAKKKITREKIASINECFTRKKVAATVFFFNAWLPI